MHYFHSYILQKTPLKLINWFQRYEQLRDIVRPLLEYATFAWDPHGKGHIKALETIQRQQLVLLKQKKNKNKSMAKNPELSPDWWGSLTGNQW